MWSFVTKCSSILEVSITSFDLDHIPALPGSNAPLTAVILLSAQIYSQLHRGKRPRGTEFSEVTTRNNEGLSQSGSTGLVQPTCSITLRASSVRSTTQPSTLCYGWMETGTAQIPRCSPCTTSLLARACFQGNQKYHGKGTSGWEY